MSRPQYVIYLLRQYRSVRRGTTVQASVCFASRGWQKCRGVIEDREGGRNQVLKLGRRPKEVTGEKFR